MRDLTNRRTVLKTLSTGTLLAIAGCSDVENSGTTDDSEEVSDGDDDVSDEAQQGEDDEELAYSWEDATWDSYWYSLYNMSANIAMAGNGVPFPLNDQMANLRDQRLPAMLENADAEQPPVIDILLRLKTEES